MVSVPRGFVILKVLRNIDGGRAANQRDEPKVQDANLMPESPVRYGEPTFKKLREDAYHRAYQTRYVCTGASPNQTVAIETTAKGRRRTGKELKERRKKSWEYWFKPGVMKSGRHESNPTGALK